MTSHQETNHPPPSSELHVPPQMAANSSSDLFDGELFGDELIDIYNAAVAVGGEGYNNNSSENNDEIPTLPPQPPHDDTHDINAIAIIKNEGVKTMEADGDDHPGARVAATAAAIDDGLGGEFRPPTSFNNDATTTTTLVPPSAAAAAAADAAVKDEQKSHPQISAKLPPTGNKEAKEVEKSCVDDTTGAAADEPRPPSASAPTTTGTKRKASTTISAAASKKLQSSVTQKMASPLTSGCAAPGATVSNNNATATKAKASPPGATQNGTGNPQQNLPPKPSSSSVSSSPAILAPARSYNSKAGKKTAATTSVPSAAVPDISVSKGPAAGKNSTTEADFQTLAQAAVSSLILSTKNGGGELVDNNNFDEASCSGSQPVIDTSTDHIKALTGSNWVAAVCSGTASGASAVLSAGASVASVSSADSKANNNNNRAKKQTLTADERARQNRDRNREHARNTRLRKKAYVEELKRTLTELVAQRDKAELEKREAAQRDIEQREVRFRVIEEFLKLRGRNEPNFASWAAILDPNFMLTLPATEFNDLASGESAAEHHEQACIKLEKVLTGVSDVMNESSSFASFLQSLGCEEMSEYNVIGFVYNCDRKYFLMDDSHAVLDWSASTTGLTPRGAQAELSMLGSIRASFCPASNKLLSASFMFDTGAVLSQLQEFMDTPGTTSADDAQAASHRADAIIDSLQIPSTGAAVVPQGESSDEGP